MRRRDGRKALDFFALNMNTNTGVGDAEQDYEPIDDDGDNGIFFGGNGDEGGSNSKRKIIEVSSQIELPFSAEIAYKAYSDLPRQPSWSSWLESVVVVNDGSKSGEVESLWTSKMLGFRYSWTAVAVKNEQPHTIQWRSVTGLRNEGVVRFYRKEGNTYHQGPTLMTLRMVFVAPRAVSSLIRRSKKISNLVQETMIAQSLKDFRDVVLEKDVENAVESETKSPTLQ